MIVQPRTPLEEEVAAVLRGSAHVLERSNKELTEEEEKALLAMDLEEVHVLEYIEMSHMLFSEIGPLSSPEAVLLLISTKNHALWTEPNMCRVFVSYSQLIRFDKESVNCRIPVLDQP